ncbi:MAG: hypothetical protein ABW199_02655 [Caulobacterales bacterium]
MKFRILIAALLLAACGQTNAEAPKLAEAPAPPPPVSLIAAGEYEAISTTAAGITGNATVSDTALDFARDLHYQTEILRTVSAADEYAAGAGAWSDLLNAPSGTQIELRRVTNTSAGAGAEAAGLCGADPVTYLALTSDEDGALKVAGFKGGEPGASANAADLCGTFLYASGSLE